jgi:hypothetical protein
VRTVVSRYQGCLSLLPDRQRRVLRLRAGVGPPPPASRTAVARRLDLEAVQVRRAERRGLRTLRRAGREGCAPVADGSGTAVAPAGADGGATLLSLGGGDFTGDGVAAAGAGGAAPGGSAGGSPDADPGAGAGAGGGGSGGVKGTSAIRPPQGTEATDITLPLLLLLLVAFAAAGAWRLHRSSRAGAAG